jgi:predicted DNA binding protein
VTGLYRITETEPKRESWTFGISAEIRRVHLQSAMQKQYRSGKRAGIERYNDKPAVIEVPTFVTGGWEQVELQAELSVTFCSFH